MSDSTGKKPSEGGFFTSIRPFLAFVDSPRYFTKPFSWLYILFAIVFLLLPFGLLYLLIDNGFFEVAPGKLIFAGVLTLIAIFVASWLAFQVWLNRRKTIQVERITVDVIIGALAKFIRTAIEAQSVFVGVAGFFAGLFSLLFGSEVLYSLGLRNSGVALLVGSLLGGYFGVWFAKLAEFLFPKIANIIVYVVVRIFNFVVHIVKQLFEYFFIFWQSIVDFTVNGWKVVIALVTKLGNVLLAIAHAPVNSNKANITYNE
jgi:hypothetical protein